MIPPVSLLARYWCKVDLESYNRNDTSVPARVKDFSRCAEVNEPFPSPLSQLDYYMTLQPLAVNTFNFSKHKDQVDGKNEDIYSHFN